MRPSAATRASIALAGFALATLGLSGCGLADDVALPTGLPTASEAPPEASDTPTETQAPPSEEPTDAPPEEPSEEPTSQAPPPEPTDEPSEDDSNVALPPATDEPGEGTATEEPDPTTDPPTETTPPAETPEETTEPPSPTPSEETTTPEPETTEPSETESASAEADADEGSGLPLWIPIVAGGALILGVALLLAWRSRRKKWDEALGVEQTQARWVLDQLLPATSDPATPLATRSANWTTAQPTLDMLQAGLAGLIADAPDEGRTETTQALSAAVTEVRQAVSADLALQAGGGAAPPAPPAPPPPGPAGPTDATAAVPPPGAPTPGPATPADPAALAASAARVALARDRLAAALAATG
jgi:hypothetical protein